MRFRFVGCLVAWMLVLALSLGSVAQSAMAAEMMPTGAAGAVSVPLADCDDCGGDAATPEVVCYAICTSAVALPSPILVKVGPLPKFETFVAVSQASWHANPDPFPPRSHVLS